MVPVAGCSVPSVRRIRLCCVSSYAACPGIAVGVASGECASVAVAVAEGAGTCVSGAQGFGVTLAVGMRARQTHRWLPASRTQLPRMWLMTHGAKVHAVQGRSRSVGSGVAQVGLTDDVGVGVCVTGGAVAV